MSTKKKSFWLCVLIGVIAPFTCVNAEVKTPSIKVPSVKVTIPKPTVTGPKIKTGTPQGFFDSGGNQLYINRATNITPRVSSSGPNRAAMGINAGAGRGKLITVPATKLIAVPPINNTGNGGAVSTGSGDGNLVAPNNTGSGSGNLIATPANNNTESGGGISTGSGDGNLVAPNNAGSGSGNLVAPNNAGSGSGNLIATPAKNNTESGGGIATGSGSGNLVAPNNAGSGSEASVGTSPGYSSVTVQKLLIPPK